jgi:hypothetical protein
MTPIQNAVAVQTANIHIDKIRITADCTHKPSGRIWYFDAPDLGQVVPANGASPTMLQLVEDGGRAQVRSTQIDDNGIAHALQIHCCPPKVLQKHNLFGHCVLQDYVYVILDLVSKYLKIDVDPADRAAWHAGQVKITEIDLTGNFGIPPGSLVSIVDAIDENNRIGKNRRLLTWIKLDRGSVKRTDFHELCIYGKAEELTAQFYTANKCKRLGPYQTKLVEEARKGIRAEVKLRSALLLERDLGYVSRWKDIDVKALYFELLMTYNVRNSIQRLLTEGEMESLSRSERSAYVLWFSGLSLEEQGLCRTSVWKYKTSILAKTGIDMSGNRRPENLPDIDLRDVFKPENLLPVPEWAIGTPYYSPCILAGIEKRNRSGISHAFMTLELFED